MSKLGGCMKVLAGLLILCVVLAVGIGVGLTGNDPPATTAETRVAPTATPAIPAPSPTATAPPAPTPTATATATATVTPTPRATAMPRPTQSVVTYAECENVPTYRLRVDTQGRVAVERDLVPSQPDGDDDGYACGGQLEHKRR